MSEEQKQKDPRGSRNRDVSKRGQGKPAAATGAWDCSCSQQQMSYKSTMQNYNPPVIDEKRAKHLRATSADLYMREAVYFIIFHCIYAVKSPFWMHV